jgi:hypothetical protein
LKRRAIFRSPCGTNAPRKPRRRSRHQKHRRAVAVAGGGAPAVKRFTLSRADTPALRRDRRRRRRSTRLSPP